jgi:hypothetical protein
MAQVVNHAQVNGEMSVFCLTADIVMALAFNTPFSTSGL